MTVFRLCAVRPFCVGFPSGCYGRAQCDPKNTQLKTFGLERHICVYRGAYLLSGCGPSDIDLLGNGDSGACGERWASLSLLQPQ